MVYKPFNYIEIDGLICTGKTYLTGLISDKLDATPIYEEFDKNPFLEKFYSNPKQYSFPTELFFLVSRYQQLSQVVQTDLFQECRISDYMFDKSKIFASITLNEQEMALYFKISDLLVRSIPKPDLILYLQADFQLLLERIKQRGRSYEESITEQYLKVLNEAYSKHLFMLTDIPVMVVNVTNLNFAEDSADFLWLLDEIQKPIKGIKYVNPEKGF